MFPELKNMNIGRVPNRPALIALLFLLCSCSAIAVEKIQLDVGYGIYHDALFYQGKAGDCKKSSARAAIMVPQSDSTMESWHEFALFIQSHDFTSIALSKSVKEDVYAAVDLLKSKGCQHITLIGASIGGSAILQALDRKDMPLVRQVVLLSPAEGPALSSDIRKLIFVSIKDFWKGRAYQVYREASIPRELIEYDSSDHGQAILTGSFRDRAYGDIISFLLDQS